MPNWRDTLEGLRDGSIPPPTPDPAALTDLSAYHTEGPIQLVADGEGIAIHSTADGGAVNVSASGTGATMNLGVGSGMGRPAIIDLSDAGVSITGTGGVGFYGVTPVAQPTGVAVTAAAIHAALVDLGLISA